ncbi:MULTISPECIES: hypothetical protein [unclassified Clostridium]|uniref:hypothetical protein n=1 Tax=unclassified Clostridium TaxID=2614128 RepID=UPI0002980D30|nr:MULTISPECIES: hypothetical protein [unclassified Clostridium]EKQ54564.1 MAG: hypothetical protein A370_03114 [Clostridium sp. Maddingley MBC34-26]
MKFYQSTIFKIVMGLIAFIIIIKFSFLILLTGIGLVVYLNIKNSKFKSFNKAGKILLSSFMILFTLLLVGIKNVPTADKTVATNSKVESNSEAIKPAEQSETKDDSKSTDEVKPAASENNKSQPPTSNDTKVQAANTDTSVKSSENTSTNSSTNNATTANTNDENTIVYCVPKSDVYHLSKDDPTLKKSKNIYEITLKEAKARGMQQSKSKADN